MASNRGTIAWFDYNPNHGPDGKFSPTPGGKANAIGRAGVVAGAALGGAALAGKLRQSAPVQSLAERIKNFVTSGAAKDAILAGAQHVLGELDENKHSLIADGVLFGLRAFGRVPPGGAVGEQIAHAAVENLSKRIGASLPESFGILKRSIDALKRLRGIKDAAVADDPELDAALVNFSAALERVKGRYGVRDGWGYKRERPRKAGPHLRDGKPRPELWLGPGAGRAHRNMNQDAGAAARERYIDRISNAWRDHRRPLATD